jgi:CRP-like cAMP-binding protein
LTHRGDPGDSVYVLINGRLRVFVQGEEGREKAVGEVARGQVVGEMALLTDAPRSATVRAIRDSQLVRVSSDVAKEFVRKHPEAMTQVTRQVVARLERSLSRPRVDESPASFALIPADPGVPLEMFATRFAAALRRLGTTEVLDSAHVDDALGQGISQTSERDADSERMLAWLQERESRWRYLVYRETLRFSNWTMRCLRQADRVLIVASANADPSPGALEAEIERRFGEATSADRHLILLHADDRSHPSGTEAWLAPRRLDHHHHVRLRSEEDYARLARIVGGRAVGLVLGGGGARGLSHVGALRAIRDLEIPVDSIGGTSMRRHHRRVHAMGSGPGSHPRDCRAILRQAGKAFRFHPAGGVPDGRAPDPEAPGGLLRRNPDRGFLAQLLLHLQQPDPGGDDDPPAGARVPADPGQHLAPGRPAAGHAGRDLPDGSVMNNLPVDDGSTCQGGTVIG